MEAIEPQKGVESEGQNAKGTGAEIEGRGKKEGPQGQASGRIRLRDNAQNRLEAGKITPALAAGLAAFEPRGNILLKAELPIGDCRFEDGGEMSRWVI